MKMCQSISKKKKSKVKKEGKNGGGDFKMLPHQELVNQNVQDKAAKHILLRFKAGLQISQNDEGIV